MKTVSVAALRTAVFVLTVFVLAMVSGCSTPPSTGGNSAGGSLGISKDDALLYAADPDRDSVFVMNTRTDSLVAEVPVGRQPEKVLVAPDDTVYVTNRLDRSVSVLKPGESREAARIAVGVEPVGLAVSSDSKTLFVVNATSLTSAEFGTLMAIDTDTGAVKWELAVGAEPRGISLMGNGRAAITLFKSGDVVFVDLDKRVVEKNGTDVFAQLNRSALSLGQGGPQMPSSDGLTARPRGTEAITTSVDGQQLYVATQLSTDGLLQTPSQTDPVVTRGSGYSSGRCGATAVTSPGLLTFSLTGEPQVDDLASCSGETVDHPPTLLSSFQQGQPLQGPRALAADPGGAFLFVAHFNSNNVALVRTSNPGTPGALHEPKFSASSVHQIISVGAGPTGIAVAHDGLRAWVFNSFDHSVSRLESSRDQVSVTRTLKLGRDVLPADVVEGRKLFFSAADARMNDPNSGIACGSCHLEGREDGHVWNFTDGPRQTPSLAGRMLSKTAPFHWNGEFKDLMSFMSLTVKARMGGTGVTEDMERQVAAFLDAQPAADNPHRDSKAPEVTRGRAAFLKAGCDSCHGGETMTDNSFADVGTFVTRGSVTDRMASLPHGLNTPSLLGLARTAPFLHDGSAPTLKARILQGKGADRHGRTSVLNDGEVDDLVAYLETL